MPSFIPHDLSPLLICAITVAVSIAGGLIPFSPLEPVLLGVAAIAPPSLLPLVVVLATLSQMGAKTLLYVGSRKALGTLTGHKRASFERVHRLLDGRRWLQILTVLVSAVVGLPPFYMVTVACGALSLPLRNYLIAGTVGRAARFTAIVMLPQLFAAA